MGELVTVDFHVTSDCNQECPYCWGPQGVEQVDTETASAIVRKVAAIGARRIVFTGGDPLLRDDIGILIETAAVAGLEVALSTSGDQLSREFLLRFGSLIDLISLPLDGASESHPDGSVGQCLSELWCLSRCSGPVRAVGRNRVRRSQTSTALRRMEST